MHIAIISPAHGYRHILVHNDIRPQEAGAVIPVS